MGAGRDGAGREGLTEGSSCKKRRQGQFLVFRSIAIHKKGHCFRGPLFSVSKQSDP